MALGGRPPFNPPPRSKLRGDFKVCRHAMASGPAALADQEWRGPRLPARADPSLRARIGRPMLMPMPNDDQVTAGAEGSLGGSSAGDGLPPALGGRDYGAVLWEPSEQSVRDARITGYAAWLRDGRGLDLATYDDVWQWSVAEPGAFWTSIWEYFGVLGRLG